MPSAHIRQSSFWQDLVPVPGSQAGGRPVVFPPQGLLCPPARPHLYRVNSLRRFLLLRARGTARDEVPASGAGARNTLKRRPQGHGSPHECPRAPFMAPWDPAHPVSAQKVSSEKTALLEFSPEGVNVAKT